MAEQKQRGRPGGSKTSRDHEVLSSRQAAEMLGCSINTIVRMVADGKLSCWMIGSHRRFSLKVIQAYKNSHEGSTSNGDDDNKEEARSEEGQQEARGQETSGN